MNSKRGSSEDGKILKFLLRKTWILTLDYIGTVLLINLSFTLMCVLLMIAARGLAASYVGMAIIFCAGTWILTWYLRAVHLFLRRLVSFEAGGFRVFLNCLKKALRHNGASGLFFFLYTLILLVGLPFYLATGSIGGYVAAAAMFWVYVAGFPVVLMLIPLQTDGGGKYTGLVPAVKKSFRLLFLKPKVMVILSCNAAALVLISVLTAFLLPGMASAVMFTLSTGLLLSEDGDKIPDHIAREKERMGKRSLKGFLLPWKE